MTSDFSTYFVYNVALRGSEALILSRIYLSLLQDVHELLTVTYGLPVWASYTIFGVTTVLLGILLGVVSFYEPSQICLYLIIKELVNFKQMSHNCTHGCVTQWNLDFSNPWFFKPLNNLSNQKSFLSSQLFYISFLEVAGFSEGSFCFLWRFEKNWYFTVYNFIAACFTCHWSMGLMFYSF